MHARKLTPGPRRLESPPAMYKLKIAWRFLWSRLVSYVSTGLLAMAVALFVVVMAVMVGVGEELEKSVRRNNADVELLAPAGPGIAQWRELIESIERMEHVEGVTPFVSGAGQAESPRYRFPCLLRGVDLARERSFGGLGPYLDPDVDLERSGPEGRAVYPGVLIGGRIAERMEIERGDLMRLTVHRADDPDQSGSMYVKAVGEFKTGSIWIDNSMIMKLEEAQKLFGTGGRLTGLGVWLDDYRNAFAVKKEIQLSLLELDEEEAAFFRHLSSEPQSVEELARISSLPEEETRELLDRLELKRAAREVGRRPGHYVEATEPQVKAWAEQHPDLAKGAANQAIIMRVIMFLIILFVAVLCTCLLWVMVEQKVRDIGILVALGARRAGAVSIFVLDGVLIGLVGTAIGLLAGVVIASNVDALAGWLGLNMFFEKVFFVSNIPQRITLGDLVLVSVVAMSASTLAGVFPALRAARSDPAESLRHE